MSQSAEKTVKRDRRHTNELDFLSESLDKILRSQLTNQDEILEHQTNLIQKLVSARNDTAVLDSHFYNIIREIRQGYTRMQEGIVSSLYVPECPEANSTIYTMSFCLIVSILMNLIIMAVLLSSCFVPYIRYC